jgi:DNA repair protein RadA/Sms
MVWLDNVPGADAPRLGTGIPEFDRVLGGGLVPGSFVLIGGDPGIGKSTLLLQAAATLARTKPPVLYVSAEESAAQIKLRATRLGVPGQGLGVLATTQLEAVEAAIRKLKPAVAVVDSIQTLWSEGLGGAPGSVGQVRECAAHLTRIAKTDGTVLLVVCHVTKDGLLAGPRTLEHLADCVLEFEGDRHHLYRILRAVKNRYGSTSEIGVFEMTGSGLREVAELGDLFLPNDGSPLAGRAVAACMEGSRPLLVEIQALTATAAYGMPQRRASGLDSNRLAILLAVLEKRMGYRLGAADVFLNVAGGLLVEEPAADLAAAMAIVSAFKDRPLARAALVGEIGLSGEVRAVIHLDRRLEEAARLGFKHAVIPQANRDTLGAAPKGLEIEGAADLAQAVERALA